MSQKKRIAFYPVFADTLPIVRYFKRYRSDVEIVELLSPLGSCVCGKDASFLDNREILGMRVVSPDEANPELWDELYLLSHSVFGVEECETQEKMYDLFIRIVEMRSKCTIVTPKFAEVDVRNRLIYKRLRKGPLAPVKKYIVFVGGVIGEANSLEVFLNLYGELSKYLNVAAISTSENARFCNVCSIHEILYDRSLLENEKVFAVSDAISNSIANTNADLVLVHSEEAMMSFSDSLTNGFGIIPFIISQVVLPDYSICCLPCDCFSFEFINDFAEGLNGRFCFVPDVWHISNALLDHTITTSSQDAHAIYASLDTVNSLLEQNKTDRLSFGSLIQNEFLARCTKDIVRDWKASLSVEIIN